MTLKFYIKTYGCQMNVHDSMRISNVLKKSGFREVFDLNDADIVIFNTCSVRENARNKVLSEIGSILHRVDEKSEKNKLIIVGGCVSTKEGESLIKESRNISIVFGPDQISYLDKIIFTYLDKKRKIVDVDFKEMPFNYSNHEFSSRHENGLTPKGTAYINIIKGCNNFCSFCIVPYTRGREKSRRIDEILNETEILIRRGVFEITLLGQNVNSFGMDTGENFVDLVRKIDSLGVKRLRFLTSHPKDLTDECIDLFFSLNSVCQYLHLPVQSGSSRILGNMNRKYDIDHFFNIISKFKKRKKDFAFGTDIIVGFPGETETDFNATLELIKEVQFENIFSFKYSPRPGTKAFNMPDDVGREIKEKRLEKLNNIYLKIRADNAKKYIGQKWEVLVEKESKYNEGFVGGRTKENRFVNFMAPSSCIGKLVDVEIIGLSNLTYKGKILESI